MPQTTCQSIFSHSLFLYISPITSIKPHPIPSDFICACMWLLCFALPAVWVWFGWEWALAAEWKRRQKRSRAKTLFQLRRLHYSRFPALLSCSIFHGCALKALLLFFHIDWFPVQPCLMDVEAGCRYCPVGGSDGGKLQGCFWRWRAGCIRQRFYCFFIELECGEQTVLGIYSTHFGLWLMSLKSCSEK